MLFVVNFFVDFILLTKDIFLLLNKNKGELNMIELVKKEVFNLMETASGHSFDHIERVYKMALFLAEQEGGDKEVIALASLLHDADDYKFVGQAQASLLLNAKKIMQKACIIPETQQKVCDIIGTMGYSNRLKGIYPQSLEGRIVSDADMLDAMGAMAIVRTLEYGLSRGGVVFNPKVFPDENLNANKYQKMANEQEPCINHFFDKLLKLRGLLFTKTAREEGACRHQLMLDFLVAFFKENQAPNWQAYLETYLKRQEHLFS